MIIRPEADRDAAAIREVNVAAFRDHPHSQQTEHLIVEALRDASALKVSLVAEADGKVIGHVAFSAAGIGDSSEGWHLLGPLAVLPEWQGQGVGSALVAAGLEEMRTLGASGVALVGDAGYYARFGFAPCAGVTCHGVPDEYVLCLLLSGDMPKGELAHHPAFLIGTDLQ